MRNIIALTFTPIMGGKLSKSDKILNAVRLVKDIDKEYRHDVESILYAFASKFLDGEELNKVMETYSCLIYLIKIYKILMKFNIFFYDKFYIEDEYFIVS